MTMEQKGGTALSSCPVGDKSARRNLGPGTMADLWLSGRAIYQASSEDDWQNRGSDGRGPLPRKPCPVSSRPSLAHSTETLLSGKNAKYVPNLFLPPEQAVFPPSCQQAQGSTGQEVEIGMAGFSDKGVRPPSDGVLTPVLRGLRQPEPSSLAVCSSRARRRRR